MTKHDSVRAGRVIDAQLHLLDRQVLDREGVPVTAVDDLELSDIPFDADLAGVEPPVIDGLLSGAVLGTRIFGGRPPASRWHRIPWGSIAELGIAIRLDAHADDLELTWPERWVRDHIIGRIPGGRHDPE
ncbi:hypothetical protein [Protaetiibacter intestinalis]|uniref:Uncharacterized protein n=1 Tax=Protaetiibacter intestinalis TaxID=2419774 RepID=A0A387B399_9MICO|nr:hypothetical protein [Protaetiibacter intestinalis]AYF98032.1 hypothetical protein D7I47_07045 [Protaetiibacter intestinalis]